MTIRRSGDPFNPRPKPKPIIGLAESIERLPASYADLDARIAANKNPAHRYPSSKRVHGQWCDGTVRPIRLEPVALEEIRADDRRKTVHVLLVLAVLAALLIVGIIGLATHPAGPTPTHAELACNLQKQVDPAYGRVDCSRATSPNEFKHVTP